MADRLTQLQICLDQLVEQFSATLNYVTSEEPTPGPPVAEPQAQSPSKRGDSPAESHTAPNPSTEVLAMTLVQQEEEFTNNVNELSTDIILKTRQIITLIDSLPGIGVSPQEQLFKIQSLQTKLDLVEKERIEKIKQKNELLDWCEEVILQVAGDMAS
ncbi:hypothetical protein BABINDRAFT_37131 [Babjeviella inositovora NRRL Y-12698]|uniref:Mediator of RNA polymerase II transcription subunit 21 n=1 Tax=Babjeviella inositovora NRRL Y-12698 TaxID=984486 RepID=A0A1E3QPV1_9ASCO|nr:uncharacterized protein BABINDRAFT_37131 [Babjeviella inositovora NRRL Y-12698]ODQ79668.1 hypothetical protein BABINDRAFT_37131 [Babjeviella inositovora NRRL Y-12698]